MTISDRYFQRLILAAMALGFILLLVAGAAAVVGAQRNQNDSAWVDHTYTVENALADFSIDSERIEAIRRGYLLLSDPQMLAKVRVTMSRMPAILDRIASLTRDNPRQQARLIRLRFAARQHEQSIDHTFDVMMNGNLAEQGVAGFDVNASIATMDALRTVLTEMRAEEQRLMTARGAEAAASLRALNATLAITGTLICLIMGGTLLVILRYTRDLNASQEGLRALNTGLEDAVDERTADLTRANGEIQRFAYIVSHDLRSPLVNVMGFTSELEMTVGPLTELIERVDASAPDLMTPEARAATVDLPEAVGFIRSSTAKMDRLINAILRLSREGRRNLAPTPIDLDAMAGSVRDSFRHRIDEIGASIEIAAPMPAIVSDRLALEQVVSNLVENALKYLQPGRPGRIVISARAEGSRVMLDVADNGRGIAPSDHERIFELFRRSGVQDQPGEGLGLAHVRALTYRLGGVINCISSLGAGATFRLSLPRVLETEVGKEPRVERE